MHKIYSSTALRDNQREVKQAACEDVVRITENGCGAYVFCSEEVFERELRKAAEEALFQAEVAAAVERGRADISAGRCVEGIEAARAAVQARRAARG